MRKIAYLRNNKFSCEKAKRRKHTVCNQWDRGQGIHNSIDVSQSLQKLQPSIVAIPYGAMPAEQNFNWSQGPSKHLVQTIRQIDGSRPLESRAMRHTIDWNPTSGMHLKPSQNIFSHRTIDPSNLLTKGNVQNSSQLKWVPIKVHRNATIFHMW